MRSELFYSSVQDAIEDYKNGKILIVVDSQDRENEGDMVVAAEFASTQVINFFTKNARGLICISLTEERINELKFPMMTENNNAPLQTAFTVSVEAKNGVTTGISAYDRAKTVADLIDNSKTADDFVVPGHMFPLKAKKGGVLVRAGHTEAAVDLALLAGLKPAGVICEVMNDDGSMARIPNLLEVATQFNIKILVIEDLIKYRKETENLVSLKASPNLPTSHGDFQLKIFEDFTGKEHIALVKGEIKSDEPVIVRVHSECLTGDILGSSKCDCGQQKEKALDIIGKDGGIFLYMRQEGRGIGLTNKMKAYELQDKGFDTVEANHHLGFDADLRDYKVAAQILSQLGVKKIRLLTNNPRKIEGLKEYGLDIIDRIPIQFKSNKHNDYYLKTKKNKLGHKLDEV